MKRRFILKWKEVVEAMKRGLAFISLLLFALSILWAGGKDFLLNGNFEGKELSGWSLAFYPRGEKDINNCIYLSNKRAKEGRQSMEINTNPVLGEEVTLVFNGAVSNELINHKGERVILSGWVYIEKGTAMRPIHMRLRTFGIDEKGNSAFLGDVLDITILGKAGEWVKFQAIGSIPEKNITGMDLHCSISPDIVPTIQFFDELHLDIFNPPLEFRLLKDALWQDENVIPVETYVNLGEKEGLSLRFTLLDGNGKPIFRWQKPAKTSIYGLKLNSKLLEGNYFISAELFDAKGKLLEQSKAQIEILKSPWEGAKKRNAKPREDSSSAVVPPAFQAIGAVAPKSVPEDIPSQPEMLSPDIDISQWQNKGYVVFSRHYLESFSLLARPRPGELINSIRIFASPGEYEPATFSIWALKPVKALRIIASDLEGEKASIPSENIDIRVVRIPRRLPIFLEKTNQIDIYEGQTRTFYLNIYIPPNTPRGFYYGGIKILPASGEPTSIELLLRVLPISLPKPRKGYGFWWSLDSRWNGYYSKELSSVLEQIRKQFILLREYGCNMVSIYNMPKMSKVERGISYDFQKDHWGHTLYSLDDLFRIGRETRLVSPKVPIQYPGAEALHSFWISREFGLELSSEAFSEFYHNACKEVDRWARKQGFLLAFACVDEIGNSPERREEALRFYRLAKEAGVLTSVTDNSMHMGVHLMGQPRFDEIIDMRVYNFITPEMIENTRKSRDRLWLYNLGSAGWYAKLDRFVFGFFTERCGAEGYSQWAFQWPAGGADPYESAIKGEHTGWHYALPAPDGPIPTLALEGVREGIDDARYLSLLPEKERNLFLRDIQPFSVMIGDYLEKHSGYFLEALRWKIARKILERQFKGK